VEIKRICRLKLILMKLENCGGRGEVGRHSENKTWRTTVALEMLLKVREIAVGHPL
jgi:hypothetical protein